MHEQLNALPLSELKELAKEKGLKGISSLRKADLIQLLCQAEGNPGRASSSEVNAPKEQAAETAQRESQGQNPISSGQTERQRRPEPSSPQTESRGRTGNSASQAENRDRSGNNRRLGNNGNNNNGNGRRDAQSPRRDQNTGSRLAGRMDGRQIRVVNRHENRSVSQDAGSGRTNTSQEEFSGRMANGQESASSRTGSGTAKVLSPPCTCAAFLFPCRKTGTAGHTFPPPAAGGIRLPPLSPSAG